MRHQAAVVGVVLRHVGQPVRPPIEPRELHAIGAVEDVHRVPADIDDRCVRKSQADGPDQQAVGGQLVGGEGRNAGQEGRLGAIGFRRPAPVGRRRSAHHGGVQGPPVGGARGSAEQNRKAWNLAHGGDLAVRSDDPLDKGGA